MSLSWKNSSNSIENSQKEKTIDTSLLSKSQNDFILSKLQDNMDFFDSSEYDISKIYTDYFSFVSIRDEYKDLSLNLSGLKKSKIETITSQLKSEVLKLTLPRKSNFKKLNEKYNFEYTLDDNSKNILNTSLSKLDNNTLISLLKYPNKRLDFLIKNDIFSDKNTALSAKKEIKTMLEREININLSTLNQEEITYLFSIFNSNSKIDLQWLDILLQSLNNWSKKALIKYFLETISYYDLKKNNILSDSLKEKIFEKFKSDSKNLIEWLEDEKIKEIFDSLDKKSYFIDLEDLENSNNIEDLFNDEKIKSRLIDIYNSEIEQNNSMQESILWELDIEWEEQNIHKSFIEKISKDKSISPYIRESINKLIEKNFIELQYFDKKWNPHFTYYYISKVDHWSVAESKVLKLKDVTTPNWFKKDLSWAEENYLYDDFYSLLKNISKPDNKDISINFYEKKDIGEKEMVEDNNINTIDQLKNKIDAIDPEWKSIKMKSDEMVISSNDDENFIFLVDSIDESSKTITINQWAWWSINVDFNKFFEVFKESKFKRRKKINNFDSFVSTAWELWLSWFNSLDIWWKNSDKICLKSDEKLSQSETYTWVKYFVWENWDAIYIRKIWKDKIEYTKWSFKESKDWFKFESWENSYNAKNFSQFLYDIEKYKLSPYLKGIKEEEKSPEEIFWEKSLKWSGLSKYMSRMSFADLMWAIKFFPENIKKTLERWSKLKSLKFAQKMAKLWPDTFYLNMKSAAEQEEKSLTEEISANLKSLWSKDMIKQVEKILLNKNSEEYEVIAAMMTVVWKYGSLYPKELRKYSWSLLWYKRLWWTQSKLAKFKEWIASAKSPEWKPQPIFFTEERLVESWLWDRAKGWTIRSRLDKDFWWALAWGMRDEMEDWAMKSGNKITTEWRISYFLWELEKLWYANAIGSLENIFWKNGSSFEMNAVPFVLTISGFAKNMDQVLLNKLIGLGFSTPFTTLIFNKDSDWINLYNNFIEQVIVDKLWGAESEAMKKFRAAKQESDSEKKVKAIYKFWTTYWKQLINHINLSDPYTIMRRNEEPVYKQYYEMLNWVHSDWEFNVKDDDITYWVYKKNPIAFTKWWISKISSDPTWGLWRPTSKDMYNMYINSFETIRNYKVWDETWVTEEQRKELFKEQFEFFSDYIKEVSWRFSKSEWAWNPIIDVMIEEVWFGLYDKDKFASKEDYLEKAYKAFMNKWKDIPWQTEEEVKIKINDLIK